MHSEREPQPLIHVLDALTDAGPGLWGKERVVAHVLEAQRAAGRYAPRLVVFVECSLAALARERGFEVSVLDSRHRRFALGAGVALARTIAASPMRPIVHAHEYKANLFARFLRVARAPMRALISTSHAWFDDTRGLALYNELDRATAGASDAVSVTDRAMLDRFPRNVRATFVANGLPDRPLPDPRERPLARRRFGFAADAYVAGFLARTSLAKGVGVFVDAARASEPGILWAVAGTGERADVARDAALANLRYAGFVEHSDAYRAAIDVYVQASFVEGLSLSLLEAMRDALPIVATGAGSTAFAIRDGIEGLIVRPGDAGALARAVGRLAHDRELATRLAAAARERFVRNFTIERQAAAFDDLYTLAVARRT